MSIHQKRLLLAMVSLAVTLAFVVVVSLSAASVTREVACGVYLTLLTVIHGMLPG